MIGFLKRWFVTKNELDSIDKQLDNLAYGIQQMQMKMLVDADGNTEQWRPTQKGFIVNGNAEVERHVVYKPVRVSNSSAVTLPSSLPRHIAEARIMIGKAGGLAKVKQGIDSRQMRVILSSSYNHNTELVYQGRLTIYDKAKSTTTKEKRYAMSFKTEKQVKEVMSYLRSSGITFKDNRK